jgi:hypothetical protein
VRFLATAFQDTVDETHLYAIQPPSALASESLLALRSAFAAARELNLSVVFCAVVDPSWDNPSNVRASSLPGTVHRGMIGRNFSPNDWAAWFASFRAYFMPFFREAALAGAHAFYAQRSVFAQRKPMRRGQQSGRTKRLKSSCPTRLALQPTPSPAS